MTRTLAASVLALAALAAAGPAHAQKQEYPSWTFDQMVPTGPHLRNLDQAQPVPGARPSHWGGISKSGEFRAGMTRYGTDVKSTTRSYSATQSLKPPPVDVTRKITAAPRSADPPAAPRTVHRD